MQYTREHLLNLDMRDVHCDKKTQSVARAKIQSTPFAKNRLRFVELLPHDGFSGDLDVDTWREIFAQIKKESDKDVKKYMLGRVLDLFFATGWGWYERHGDSLSGFGRKIWQISDRRRDGAVKVLKMLRKQLYDTRQWTRWSNIVIQTIRDYGGTVNPQPSHVRFNNATKKIVAKKRGVLGRLFENSATK